MSGSPRTPAGKIVLLPQLIFASRWLQLPLYLGLIAAQMVCVRVGNRAYRQVDAAWQCRVGRRTGVGVWHEMRRCPGPVGLSPAIERQRGVSLRCLRAKTDAPLSHDNYFHSVLGLAGGQTGPYRVDLDIYANCGAPKMTVHLPSSVPAVPRCGRMR